MKASTPDRRSHQTPFTGWSGRELDELAWNFLGSEFTQDVYADWPLDRRLDAYLRHHERVEIVNDSAAYNTLLDRVMANIGPALRRGIRSQSAGLLRRRSGNDMTHSGPAENVIGNAVMLACRAPSLHNTQPWRWIRDGAASLFADYRRMVLSTDSTGREVVLSCGAVLDHLQVAMAAAGWEPTIERFPDPHDPDHVAAVWFTQTETVTDAQRERADAILRRRTDRLPFDAALTGPRWRRGCASQSPVTT